MNCGSIVNGFALSVKEEMTVIIKQISVRTVEQICEKGKKQNE